MDRLLVYFHSACAWLRGDDVPLSYNETSRAISFARLSLIVGLVFLHYQQFPNSTLSPFVGMDVAHHQVATFVNSFVLFFFFSVVPLLSMVSGWLFFSFDSKEPALALRRRIGRRFKSLYLPLVFWNSLFVVILLVVYRLAPSYALFHELNIRFDRAHWLEYLDAITGLNRHPIAFQFWFVRDLFVTALVSPLLWIALQRFPHFGMAFLGVTWLVGGHLGIFFRTDVVFFFYVGAYLRLRHVPLQVCRRATLILLAVYVGLVVLRALAPVFLDLSHHRPELLSAATRSMRLLGVVACWGLFLQISPTRFGGAVARTGGLAFFLYSIHYPLIAVVKIALWRWIPAPTDSWMLIHYLASVIVTVAIGLGTGLLLARLMPRWFALLNGGRLVAARPPVSASAAPVHIGGERA